MAFEIVSTQWYVLPTGLIKTQKILIEDFVSLRFRSWDREEVLVQNNKLSGHQMSFTQVATRWMTPAVFIYTSE